MRLFQEVPKMLACEWVKGKGSLSSLSLQEIPSANYSNELSTCCGYARRWGQVPVNVC